jgi:N-acetylmuramoyl-L-alanine amidase
LGFVVRLSSKVLAGIAVLALLSPAPALARRTVAQKKKIAQQQFEQAERLRDALRGKPETARTRRDYQRVVDAYRKVYYIAPTSRRADESALAVGDLLVELGRAFKDNKSFHDAIGQYEFLQREYPGSRHRIEALFTTAQIYREDLNDKQQAKQTFEEVIKRYVYHELAESAQDALKEMADEAKGKSSKKKKAELARRERKRASPPKDEAREIEIATAGADSKLPLVTGIRHWSTPDYTRIAIDLETEVKYEAGRVPGPDRIFFDLHSTKLASELVGKQFEVGDGFLRKIRAAQFDAEMTRVVLEVDDVSEYSAFLLPNPYRLIVDIYGKQQKPAVADSKPPASSEDTQAEEPVVLARAEDATRALTQPFSAISREIDRSKVTSESEPTSQPTVEVVAPRKASKKPKPESKLDTGKAARPLSDGDRSLIRALGLKVGRIVIDAGHGGHDTGTIGPNGLKEKDVALDVALRLGKLLESKLGAEVIYTREDDTFVPLESRTALANKQEADLFISLHANSSRNRHARGVETYYLNFTSNAEALEVAARENAVSQSSVFELQDLVKQITMRDKIDESREFAASVQQALYTGLGHKNNGFKDRGVKKAPFVVLIGANMPSILAEMSFVSNPTDAQRMRRADHRQRIAESLFKGIEKYANGLSGIRSASKLAEAKVAAGTD